MDAWGHENALARQIRWWAGANIVGGAALALLGARRANARLRDFGLQSAGWGVINAGIGAVADRVRERKLARLPEPMDPEALAREHRLLWRLLVINAGLDVGYLAAGLAWFHRRGGDHPSSQGHGAAVLFQGAFLLVFDLRHAGALGRPSG